MASPLSEMQIGSPLPEHKDLIAKQIINGQIEFMNKQQDLHYNSNVVLRSVRELGLNTLNGVWTFTPKYLEKNATPIAYTFGHMQSAEEGGYVELLTALTQRAEQEFYFGPLQTVRKFLIQHDSISGRTNLLMPDSWSVLIDPELAMADFLGVVEGYVQSEQRQLISSGVYEDYYNTSRNTNGIPVRLYFSKGELIIREAAFTMTGFESLFDMTPVVKFISRPWEHGLNQDIFRQYRKLVNL